MKLYLLLILFVCCTQNIFSQFNLQAGYDVGFYDMTYNSEYLLSEKKGSHLLHRAILKVEYQFKNNLLFGINTGIDFHNYRHEIMSIMEGNTYIENHSKSIHESIFRTNRVGLSFGFKHHINNNSKLFFTLSYDQFIISSVKNKESLRIEENYLYSESSGKYLANKTESYETMINLDEIGYYQKLNLDNRHVIFSIGYRYQINEVFFSSSLKFSPFNRSFVDPIFISPTNQNIYLFNLTFGYTFSKKSEKDEK